VTIELENGIHVQSFVNDTEGGLWHVDDYARRIAVYENPQAFELVDREEAALPYDASGPGDSITQKDVAAMVRHLVEGRTNQDLPPFPEVSELKPRKSWRRKPGPGQ
jgi:hypothetical protein